MAFRNFFNAELKCSSCNRSLKSGDEIFVHITLPNENKMPVGVLDKVLSKYSDTVYCKTCYQE
ncbi:hypothetical protein GLW07_08905 [Bacillus hwajinpoensis]|uniref:Fe3+ hydroxamate ABC transporter substrate-binding protein n=1 Tax=Guptibacillus hwajinpoensis TaxID=208199 RepID=A0A845EY32_9BACL|nr:hypothetical protein [Pseudalkalibacillus hwajinpoensis]MYL63470.1 hypothetical protein [Pseudalkalibacillus hwajinpoensis]